MQLDVCLAGCADEVGCAEFGCGWRARRPFPPRRRCSCPPAPPSRRATRPNILASEIPAVELRLSESESAAAATLRSLALNDGGLVAVQVTGVLPKSADGLTIVTLTDDDDAPPMIL